LRTRLDLEGTAAHMSNHPARSVRHYDRSGKMIVGTSGDAQGARAVAGLWDVGIGDASPWDLAERTGEPGWQVKSPPRKPNDLHGFAEAVKAPIVPVHQRRDAFPLSSASS
jgi:hypothetical protein